jgi:hypothetical protein
MAPTGRSSSAISFAALILIAPRLEEKPAGAFSGESPDVISAADHDVGPSRGRRRKLPANRDASAEPGARVARDEKTQPEAALDLVRDAPALLRLPRCRR